VVTADIWSSAVDAEAVTLAGMVALVCGGVTAAAVQEVCYKHPRISDSWLVR